MMRTDGSVAGTVVEALRLLVEIIVRAAMPARSIFIESIGEYGRAAEIPEFEEIRR